MELGRVRMHRPRIVNLRMLQDQSSTPPSRLPIGCVPCHDTVGSEVFRGIFEIQTSDSRGKRGEFPFADPALAVPCVLGWLEAELSEAERDRLATCRTVVFPQCGMGETECALLSELVRVGRVRPDVRAVFMDRTMELVDPTRYDRMLPAGVPSVDLFGSYEHLTEHLEETCDDEPFVVIGFHSYTSSESVAEATGRLRFLELCRVRCGMRHVNFRQLVFCSDFCRTTPERRIAHEDDRFHFVAWHCPWEEVIAVVEAEKDRL